MTTLLAAIRTKRPREKSGSWTSARYDFQRHLSILKIIDLQEQGTDYRVIFDYLDDLMILDSAVAPQKVRFFQIKAKTSGCWRMKDIADLPKSGNAPRSIFGKMHYNAELFGATVEGIVFISNAVFNLLAIRKPQAAGATRAR